MYNGYTIRIPERTAHARSHPQIWRQREELDDDEDDDDEDISSWVLVYEYEEDDLPDTFLGVPIDRQNRPVMPSCTDTISVPRAAAAINIDVNQATSPTTDEDEERPPTPWGNSTAKTRIIDCLKDKTSDIHLQIGEYTPDSFQNVNFKQIHKSYANKYKPSLFRENFKRLLRHLLKKTGPFEEKEDTVEPWATRKKRSAGWHLLYELRMVKETNDQLNSMTDEEIWESNKLFKQYPLEDFKKYNKDMATSTAIQRKRIEDEEKDFEQHCKNIPHNKVTDRGEPFWYIHPAKAFLIEDVESGLAYDIKPAALRETRDEYKEFKLKTFRKHVDQEKERQRAAPYWRYKRNIAARQQIEKEREEMRIQWTVDRLGEKLGSIEVVE